VLIWIFLGRPLAVIFILAGALLLARFLRRWVQGRWYWPVVLTVVLGWLVLPTASALVSREGWSENGMSMGGELTYFLSHGEAGAPTEAAEICGDAEGFDINDPTLRSVTMPVPATPTRHFYLSWYSNIVWAGVGWKDRYCLARYRVTVRPFIYPVPFPVQIFPYPLFAWSEDRKNESYKLLERLPLVRPPAPEGVKVLLPGECWAGRIGTGEKLKFQVEMPDVGQQNELHLHYDCEHPHSLSYHWTRNGQPIDDIVDRKGGKATYQIGLEGPSSRPQGYAIPYQVGVYWGHTPDCWQKNSDERCPEKTGEKP